MNNAQPLNGAREILDGNLNLCLNCKDNLTVRVLLMQTMQSMKKVGAAAVDEFQQKARLLHEESSLPEPGHTVLTAFLSELAAAKSTGS